MDILPNLIKYAICTVLLGSLTRFVPGVPYKQMQDLKQKSREFLVKRKASGQPYSKSDIVGLLAPEDVDDDQIVDESTSKSFSLIFSSQNFPGSRT